MLYATMEIKVPEAMKTYILRENSQDELLRNALLLYPYILNKNISHGKAAELLGIRKLELIDLYGKLGFAYFDQIMDELEKDLETFRELGIGQVVTQ